jgi:uncharacterized protein (UPF0332 family)
MTWIEIGKSNLKAAKRLVVEHPRSSASRAYYAAHVVLTDALLRSGYIARPNAQTAPHRDQAILIGRHLSGKGFAVVKELRSLIRRLYAYRIDADYKRTVVVDPSLAKDSIRNASTLFRLLGVR